MLPWGLRQGAAVTKPSGCSVTAGLAVRELSKSELEKEPAASGLWPGPGRLAHGRPPRRPCRAAHSAATAGSLRSEARSGSFLEARRRHRRPEQPGARADSSSPHLPVTQQSRGSTPGRCGFSRQSPSQGGQAPSPRERWGQGSGPPGARLRDLGTGRAWWTGCIWSPRNKGSQVLLAGGHGGHSKRPVS